MQDILFTSRIYIFGAQSRGKTLNGYLKFLYPQTQVLAFLVDRMDGNEPEIDKIPVWELDSASGLDNSCSVFIATKGIYQDGIKRRLEESGMKDIIPVSVEVDNFLRNKYVRKQFLLEHREFSKITDLQVQNVSAAIYMAGSVHDRPLQTQYVCPEYERVIQAGAALDRKSVV